MSTELIFEDQGWTVVTSAWTVASKGAGISICYAWSMWSGFSGWGDSATGVARVDLTMSMSQFLEWTKDGGRVDLRVWQHKAPA